MGSSERTREASSSPKTESALKSRPVLPTRSGLSARHYRSAQTSSVSTEWEDSAISSVGSAMPAVSFEHGDVLGLVGSFESVDVIKAEPVGP